MSRANLEILNAGDFGVPQDRQRLFLIGWRKGEVPVTPPTPTTARVGRRRPRQDRLADGSVVRSAVTVWDAIGDLSDLTSATLGNDANELVLSEADLASLDAWGSAYSRLLRQPELDERNASYLRAWDEHLLTNLRVPRHSAESIRRFEATEPGHEEPVSRLPRLRADELSFALRAGSTKDRGGFTAARPLHPLHPRVITVREAARLHSYPDWFRFNRATWHGFRQIGNSVPPLLARAVASQIMDALGAEANVPVRRLELGDIALLSVRANTRALRLD